MSEKWAFLLLVLLHLVLLFELTLGELTEPRAVLGVFVAVELSPQTTV